MVRDRLHLIYKYYDKKSKHGLRPGRWSNISLHINNIYDEGELEQIATVKDYLTAQ